MNSKKVVEQEKALREDFNFVANTKEGRNVLRYFMTQCGYNSSSVVINKETMEINALATVYNEARKDVYYGARRYISQKLLKKIEFMEE